MTGPSAATESSAAADPRDAGTPTAVTAPPRPHVVAALLAGRGVFRSAVYIAGLTLLAIWGQREFAAYAAPMGALAWFTIAVSSGPEKAALTLIPRRGGAHLQPLLRTVALAGLAAPLTAWLLLAAAGAGDAAVRYAASATFAGGIGCATVLVALYRLRGSPLVDSAAFLAMAVAYAVAVALAALAGARPGQVLTLLAAAGLAVNAGLLAGLLRGDRVRGTPPAAGGGRPSPDQPAAADDPQSPRIPRRAALRATALLGTAELLSTAGTSALYAVFAAAGDAAATSLFYVLLVITSIVSTGWGYLTRLAQPAVVGWVERVGEAAGWRAARRCLGWTMAAGAPATAAVAVAALIAADRWPAYLAIAVEIVLSTANTASALLLEVSGARGRRWSVQSAAGQFTVVAATGALLVPAAGALGGVTALVAGELIRTGLLLVAAARSVHGSTSGR